MRGTDEGGSKVRRSMEGRGSGAVAANITRPQSRDGGAKAVLGWSKCWNKPQTCHRRPWLGKGANR